MKIFENQFGEKPMVEPSKAHAAVVNSRRQQTDVPVQNVFGKHKLCWEVFLCLCLSLKKKSYQANSV